jgi:hypothetical protein
MRRAFAVFALTAAFMGPVLAAPAAPASSPADDRARLVIEAGRLAVMMDQSRGALTLLGTDGAHGDLEDSVAQRAYAFQELVAAVLHYNLLLARACRGHVARPALCTGPYLPAWLTDPPGKDHSEAALKAMVEEVSAHLMPFWDEMCAKGRAAAKDEHFCDLE